MIYTRGSSSGGSHINSASPNAGNDSGAAKASGASKTSTVTANTESVAEARRKTRSAGKLYYKVFFYRHEQDSENDQYIGKLSHLTSVYILCAGIYV